MDFPDQFAKIVGQEKAEELKTIGVVAGQIAKARHQKEISQQQLDDAIGCSRSTIARIEAGTTVPSLNTLSILAQALNTNFIFNQRGEVTISDLDQYSADDASQIAEESLDELLSQVTEENKHEFIDWGKPEGKKRC